MTSCLNLVLEGFHQHCVSKVCDIAALSCFALRDLLQHPDSVCQPPRLAITIGAAMSRRPPCASDPESCLWSAPPVPPNATAHVTQAACAASAAACSPATPLFGLARCLSSPCEFTPRCFVGPHCARNHFGSSPKLALRPPRLARRGPLPLPLQWGMMSYPLCAQLWGLRYPPCAQLWGSAFAPTASLAAGGDGGEWSASVPGSPTSTAL